MYQIIITQIKSAEYTTMLVARLIVQLTVPKSLYGCRLKICRHYNYVYYSVLDNFPHKKKSCTRCLSNTIKPDISF